MDSRMMFLVVFVISSVVPYTKANWNMTPLNYNFTRSDCGQNKLCVENPPACDPSGTSECFFASMRFNTTDTSLAIELSGNSTGYIALAAGDGPDLSQGLHAVFVCGIDNGTVFFKTAGFKDINNTLEEISFPNVSNIQYSLKNQSLIQCAFTISINLTSNDTINILDIDFNITNIPVFLEVFHGSYNGTDFGAPMSAFGSSFPVYLADVKSSSATNSISSTTSTPNTTTTTNTTTTPNTTATIPTTTTNTTTTPNTTLNTTIPTTTTPNTTATIPTTTTNTTTTPNTTATIPTTTTNTTTTPNTTLNTTIPTTTTTTPNTTANTTTTIPTTTTTTTAAPTIKATTKPTTNDSTSLFSHAALGLLAAVALRFL